jgi:hypothetical protein
MSYIVKTGQRCTTCAKDDWTAVRGALRCACGQWLWIDRVSDTTGTHFPYRQGPTVPATFPGWAKQTE